MTAGVPSESNSGPILLELVTERIFPAGVIGVISDTHVWRGGGRSLAADIPDFFARANVDLILHAGDVNDRLVLAQLAAVAPLLAVRGNNDDDDLQELLAERATLRVGNIETGLIHGHQGRSGRETAANAFGPEIDLVIYGHSHLPKIERSAKGQILFNPGSPTDRRWAAHFGIGLLDCRFATVHPSLILFRAPEELKNLDPRVMLESSAQEAISRTKGSD